MQRFFGTGIPQQQRRAGPHHNIGIAMWRNRSWAIDLLELAVVDGQHLQQGMRSGFAHADHQYVDFAVADKLSVHRSEQRMEVKR